MPPAEQRAATWSLSLVVHGGDVVDAGFDGSGCGAALAAGSAAVDSSAAARCSTRRAWERTTSRRSSAG